MAKGRIVEMYRQMATEGQQTYHRWLTGNLILSSLMAGAIVVMAVMGATRAPDNQTVVAGQETVGQTQR
jgi:hypothetical protein